MTETWEPDRFVLVCPRCAWGDHAHHEGGECLVESRDAKGGPMQCMCYHGAAQKPPHPGYGHDEARTKDEVPWYAGGRVLGVAHVSLDQKYTLCGQRVPNGWTRLGTPNDARACQACAKRLGSDRRTSR